MDTQLLMNRVAFLEKENEMLKRKVNSLERLSSKITQMYSELKNKFKSIKT